MELNIKMDFNAGSVLKSARSRYKHDHGSDSAADFQLGAEFMYKYLKGREDGHK